MALSENLRGALFMNLSMFAFTVNDAFMKAATTTLPLYQAIALRGALAVAALLVIALATGAFHWRPTRGEAGLVALRALADVAATFFFLTALLHMPLANLSAIMQFLPLAVTLVAALVYGDRIGWRRMTAILVGFAGVMIIIRPGTDGFDVWSLLGVASVGCVVVRDLSVRPLASRVPSILVALAAGTAVLAMGLIGTAFQGWQPVNGHEALLLLGAGLALPFGYLSSVTSMRVGDIGFVAPFRYTSLLWAILLGWLVFASFPDGWTILGSLIVVGAGVFTLLRERALRRRGAL